jgi:hypothetical protein
MMFTHLGISSGSISRIKQAISLFGEKNPNHHNWIVESGSVEIPSMNVPLSTTLLTGALRSVPRSRII